MQPFNEAEMQRQIIADLIDLDNFVRQYIGQIAESLANDLGSPMVGIDLKFEFFRFSTSLRNTAHRIDQWAPMSPEAKAGLQFAPNPKVMRLRELELENAALHRRLDLLEKTANAVRDIDADEVTEAELERVAGMTLNFGVSIL